jgi:hypothetical protein
MNNTINTEQIAEKKDDKKKLPFLVKAVALFLIVYGGIGFFYYLFVLIFSLINPQFLHNLQYESFKGTYLLMPLFFKVIFNAAFIIAGIFFLLRKRKGQHFFYYTIFVSFLFSLFFLNYFNVIDFAIILIILIIIWINKHHFSNN